MTSTAIDEALDLLAGLGRADVPVGPLTTYRVGGRAAILVTAESEDDLRRVQRAVVATGVPTLVIGNGSNLVLAEVGFPGIAITLGDGFAGVDIADLRVRAGAAVSLPVLARRTVAAGLTGFEWAVGVPGSVGGAVRMNAGGHGSDLSATLRRYRFVDLLGGDDGERSADALQLGYRRSNVAPHHVVVEAELELAPGDRAAGEAELTEIVRWRREHQPGGQNAGSVFTNPPGDSAGRLIDAAGLKGHRRGSASVSIKHANFIQADEGGSADDVHALIFEVQALVEERLGVRLEPEVRLIGFDPPSTSGSGLGMTS